MKKLLLIVGILFCLSAKSQGPEPWTKVETNGLGLGNTFETYAMDTFDTKLYLSLSDVNTSKIFSSIDGLGGGFAEDLTFSTFSAAYPDDYHVCTLTPVNNGGSFLYAGTYNFISGPKVFMYSKGTSTWSLVGPMNFSPNAATDYSQISKIIEYNGEVYAFLASQGALGFSIVKNTIGSTGAWTSVYNSANSINDGYRIYDAIVFAGNLYFSTDGSVNRCWVYDGVTVSTATGMEADVMASNPNNYGVTAFGIFNGELYCGTYNNTTGAELYKSTNGTSWTLTTSGGFVPNSNAAFQMEDIVEYNGEMWVSVLTDGYNWNPGPINSGGPSTLGGSAVYTYCHSSDGVTFTRSNDAGWNETNHTAFNDNLSVFKHRIYGSNNYGGLTGGQIWEHCLTPIANFTSDIADSTCEFSIISCLADTLHVTDFEWSNDLNNFGIGPDNYTFGFSGVGTHTINLQVTNTDFVPACQAIYSKTFEIVASPTVTCMQTPAANLCPGQTFTITTTINGGVGVYAYNWQSSSYPTQTTASFTLSAGASDSYTAIPQSSKGCTGWGGGNITVDPATDLIGTTIADSGPITSGVVYIFIHQPGNAALDTVGNVAISATGTYTFTALNYGDYLVKAIPNSGLFPNAMTTYYDSIYVTWATAKIKFHGCSQTDTANIRVIETPGTTGPGVITGRITEDAGFGQRLMQPGDPIPGIDIKLGKKPGGGAQARVQTDVNGEFSFTGVPIGDYAIYVDIPNLPMDSTREVSINAGNLNSPNNDYKVDSLKIFVDSTSVGIATASQNIASGIKAFPVPSTNFVTFEYYVVQAEMIEIELYTITGEKLQVIQKSMTQPGTYTLNLNAKAFVLSPGNYLFSLRRSSGKAETVKFVITD